MFVLLLQTLISDALKRMRRLRRLIIPNVANNKMVETAAKFCPNLEELDVSKSSVDDNHLRLLFDPQLPGCPKLSRLSINECFSVSPKCVAECVKELPNLRTLDYHDTLTALKLLYPDWKTSQSSSKIDVESKCMPKRYYRF